MLYTGAIEILDYVTRLSTYVGGFGAVVLAYVGQLFSSVFPTSGQPVQLETDVVKHNDQMLSTGQDLIIITFLCLVQDIMENFIGLVKHCENFYGFLKLFLYSLT